MTQLDPVISWRSRKLTIPQKGQQVNSRIASQKSNMFFPENSWKSPLILLKSTPTRSQERGSFFFTSYLVVLREFVAMEIFPQKIDGAAAWLRKTAHPSKWPRICSHTPTTTRSKAHFAPENFRRGTLYFLGNPFTVFTVQVHFPLPFPVSRTHRSLGRLVVNHPNCNRQKAKKLTEKSSPATSRVHKKQRLLERKFNLLGPTTEWFIPNEITGIWVISLLATGFVSRQLGIVFESLGSLLKV